jgi:hypothetical protein
MDSLPALEEIYEFILGLFEDGISVRGKTAGMPVGLETPCHDCFHLDGDGVDMCIGGPIQKHFGLECFNLRYGLSSHCYSKRELGDSCEAFYRKYPADKMGEPEFTLAKFCEMIFDFIKIKNGIFIE